MLFDDLKENGFVKVGNWYHGNTISVNLIAGTLEHIVEPHFLFQIDAKYLTIDDILEFEIMMEKLVDNIV